MKFFDFKKINIRWKTFFLVPLLLNHSYCYICDAYKNNESCTVLLAITASPPRGEWRFSSSYRSLIGIKIGLLINTLNNFSEEKDVKDVLKKALESDVERCKESKEYFPDGNIHDDDYKNLKNYPNFMSNYSSYLFIRNFKRNYATEFNNEEIYENVLNIIASDINSFKEKLIEKTNDLKLHPSQKNEEYIITIGENFFGSYVINDEEIYKKILLIIEGIRLYTAKPITLAFQYMKFMDKEHSTRCNISNIHPMITEPSIHNDRIQNIGQLKWGYFAQRLVIASASTIFSVNNNENKPSQWTYSSIKRSYHNEANLYLKSNSYDWCYGVPNYEESDNGVTKNISSLLTAGICKDCSLASVSKYNVSDQNKWIHIIHANFFSKNGIQDVNISGAPNYTVLIDSTDDNDKNIKIKHEITKLKYQLDIGLKPSSGTIKLDGMNVKVNL